MITLTPTECRVLGTLIEKAMTTPDQYPQSLNSLTAGCNQKNNREPVTALDSNDVLDALNGLRAKGLVVQVDSGGRVPKYRHEAREKIPLTATEVSVIAELLLRGPQTMGELRGRASRMYPMETLDVVKNVLDQLMGRPEPLVQRLPPSPGIRAERFAQLLCPELHPLDAVAPAGALAPSAPLAGGLADRVSQLEAQVAVLRKAVQHLARQLGEPDPTTEMDAQ